MNKFFKKICYAGLISCISFTISYGQTLGNFVGYETHANQLLFTTNTGCKLSLKAYTDDIIRVQAIKKGEDFFKDDHYEIVASHQMSGVMQIADKGDHFDITTNSNSTGLLIRLNKLPLTLEFKDKNGKTTYVKDQRGIEWNGNNITTSFINDEHEHFCGLGHQAYGLVSSIDLKGQLTSCNYGDTNKSIEYAGQSYLIVPFFMSNKGYGIFMNSTFPNEFNFGKDNQYQFKIDTRGYVGQMDYFFIAGPQFTNILDRYTQLTGRPRLPQMSIFGLQLSDKGSPKNEGASWWENKIDAHRAAGYPLDHIVNDNRWRAGTGAWSGSWFEWDKSRYPDPQAYQEWCKKNGLTMTLDFNRNISAASMGWKPSYNIPNSEKVKESFSVPDYSSPEVRNWMWSLFWDKSFNPKLKYPGNAIWMDEIDELVAIPDSAICANGLSWAENRNNYPFLVAKAVVQEGWDNENKNNPPGIGEAERPFVWCRGMSAGAQRYATHWSGDLKCSYDWMQKTIRGMQVSGLSGFPYFNHDAGGFREPGPDDSMYMQWSLAMGSFSPIWRPHGIGSSRWPLDRSELCQTEAMKYSKLRYQMMPYIYTMAYWAHAKGMPMVRSMVIDYQNDSQAWNHDLQYMWGNEMLVAPQTSSENSVMSIWLPPGQKWYTLWNDQKLDGGQIIKYDARVGELPVFIKEGAIIPQYKYAQSTFWLNHEKLVLEIYPGKDGSYTLYEDDGVSEKYDAKNEKRFTTIYYNDKTHVINIKAAQGSYEKAPLMRSYEIVFHQMDNLKHATINKKRVLETTEKLKELKSGDMLYRDSGNNELYITTAKFSVNKDVVIQLF